MSGAGGFRRLAERVVYEGFRITTAVGTYEAPDGSRFERDVVHHPGAVAVVPVTGEGEVLLVRQYRAVVDATLLEIPAGIRDVPGEEPEATAARELAEEAGVRAGRLERLGEMYNSPGFCDEKVFLFLARDLEATDASAHGVEEEHMTVERVALADVARLVAAGEILDAKTIAGLALAHEALRA